MCFGIGIRRCRFETCPTGVFLDSLLSTHDFAQQAFGLAFQCEDVGANVVEGA